MNKNSKHRRALALKSGDETFEIPKTMPGSSMTYRKQTIAIGAAPRKSTKPKVARGK